MRVSLIALLLLSIPAFSYDDRYMRYQPGHRRVIRTGGQFLARGYSRRSFHRNYYGAARDQSWRLYRVRRPWAHQDPYSYGRCYWRGYYRPYLYCRQYTPRYSFYQPVRRYPGLAARGGPSYPHAFARPPLFAYGPYGNVGWGVPTAYGIHGYGTLYQSRYGFRHPHTYMWGGAGPYGFADPWGYRLLPAFDFAPILTRLTTVFTIDDPAFDGDEPENADGLPQPRTKPVGSRFLTPVD